MAPQHMISLQSRSILLFVLHLLLLMFQNGAAFASSETTRMLTTQLSVTRSSLVGDIYCLVNYNTTTTPMNITEPFQCGGVAAAAALSRQHRNLNSSFLDVYFVDQKSSFVQMHPQSWAVNVNILQQILNASFVLISQSLLTQDERDFPISKRDLKGLQTLDLAILSTNANLPPTLSWFPFWKTVKFDAGSGLAVMSVTTVMQEVAWDAVSSTRAMLNHVHWINTRLIQHQKDKNSTTTISSNIPTPLHGGCCWTTNVLVDDQPSFFKHEFLPGMISAEHPPALVAHLRAAVDSSPDGMLVEQLATDANNATMWVAHHGLTVVDLIQHQIEIDRDTGSISNISAVRKLPVNQPLPQSVLQLDSLFAQQVTQIQQHAQEALEHDPIVGYTGEIPPHASLDQFSYRSCLAGECALGNLFTDALRWHTGSDIAFITSGGLQSQGWPAGPVRVSYLWDALPFPNTPCVGVASGYWLYQILDDATRLAYFDGYILDFTNLLLQVSDTLQVVYNTQLGPYDGPTPRLTEVRIWNETLAKYQPLERFRLYKFATDSFVCSWYPSLQPQNKQYPLLKGEQLPQVLPQQVLHQTIVQQYLTEFHSSTDNPYNTTTGSRLVNDTSTTIEDILEFPPLEIDDCGPGFVWSADRFECVSCIDTNNVAFSDTQMEFSSMQRPGNESTRDSTQKSMDEPLSSNRVLLVNRELFPVRVYPKSIPSWIAVRMSRQMIGEENNSTNTNSTESQGISSSITLTTDEGWNASSHVTELRSGDSLAMDITVTRQMRATGQSRTTIQSSFSFGIEFPGNPVGCRSTDATVDLILLVIPPQNLNQLGPVRIYGFVLTAVVLLLAMCCAAFVYIKKDSRVIKALQPLFLLTISIGVSVLAMSMIPASLDDEIVQSDRGNDIACQSVPWLLSFGFSISFAAIYSKLYRVNCIFGERSFRRVVVRERDVLIPFAALLSLNLIILLIWTLVDPLMWTREPVTEDEPWNTVGKCRGSNTVVTGDKRYVGLSPESPVLFGGLNQSQYTNLLTL